MRRTAAAALLATSALLLAACGGSSAADPSAAASPSASGADCPAASPAPVPTAANPALPTVAGAAGTKPTFTFPASPAPTELTVQVLTTGTGPIVRTCDQLVVDYLGQIWNGAVFDNSFDRGEASVFPIGVGQVPPGWDKALVGLPVGSRVLAALPPAEGYGTAGQSQAGIKGTDTLVFLIEIKAAYSVDAKAPGGAIPQPAPSTGPQVTGDLTAQPTVTVPAGSPEPTEPTAVVLAKGTGPAVVPGEVITRYAMVDWTGKAVESTWDAGVPTTIPVGTKGDGSITYPLQGIPVGSRVLLTLPGSPANAATGQAAIPARAVVIDLVAQATVAKQ
ncbi:MAG: FKBP-type peptidyl-prolyl cis-trans isomerase [Actinomycetota bacterium]|nr:MAG: FKBP-type peptidyl-prolyl cis-trans isomerase [Actinomycetota bacterium]